MRISISFVIFYKMKTIITSNILLKPEHLDSNIFTTILDKSFELKGTYNQLNGYIHDIYEVKSLNQNIISKTTSNILFEVELLVETIKPEKGDIFKGVIVSILQQGIFLKIENVINVLIHIGTIPNGRYDRSDSSVSSGDKKYRQNDTVEIKIVNVEYNNGNFNCIAELVI